MEELEQQQNRLLRLHERHISVPLFNMEETYEKYLSFLDMIEATVRAPRRGTDAPWMYYFK